MSEYVIKKANRKAKKLRLGLSAASGFGKTYGALLVAKGICNGDLSKTCIIDTEKDSSTLYADLGEYSTLRLDAPYSPERYINAIITAENAGFDVIVIDSITHEWNGSGGCLEIQAALGGRYQDWAKVTPRHDAFINKILSSSCHIITTVRRKQDYDMVSTNGKTTIQKVGTAEITRDGFEYELDINFEIVNEHHMVKVSKDRTRLFVDKPEFIITEETGKEILKWCNNGVDSLTAALSEVNLATEIVTLTEIFNQYKNELKDNKEFIEAIKAQRSKIETK